MFPVELFFGLVTKSKLVLRLMVTTILLLFLLSPDFASPSSKASAQGSTISGKWVMAHWCESSDWKSGLELEVLYSSPNEIYALHSWPLDFDPYKPIGSFVRIRNVSLSSREKVCTKEYGEIPAFGFHRASDFVKDWKTINADGMIMRNVGLNLYGVQICPTDDKPRSFSEMFYYWFSKPPPGLEQPYFYHFNNLHVSYHSPDSAPGGGWIDFDYSTTYSKISGCPSRVSTPTPQPTDTPLPTSTNTPFPTATEMPTVQPVPTRGQDLPSRIDLSADMPPVKLQQRGDCTAWAVGYYYKSYQERKKRHWEYSDAHTFSPSYIFNQSATSPKWGPSSVEYAFQVLASQGVAPLSVFPYRPLDWSKPSEEVRVTASLYKIASYQKLCAPCGFESIEVLKRHLASGDPFVMSIPIYLRSIEIVGWDPIIIEQVPTVIEYGSAWAVYPMVKVKDYGHAITVVGYDDSTRRFKFVNSWGLDWGDKPLYPGYGYITYGTVVEFAIEAFSMSSGTTRKISLQASNGQYVSAEGGGGREVVANRNAIQGWEIFDLTELGDNRVALRASNGQYVSAEGGGGQQVVANRNTIGPWETFELITLGGKVAFRASNGQYVSAEGGGGRELVANRNAIQGWETFTLIEQ